MIKKGSCLGRKQQNDGRNKTASGRIVTMGEPVFAPPAYTLSKQAQNRLGIIIFFVRKANPDENFCRTLKSQVESSISKIVRAHPDITPQTIEGIFLKRMRRDCQKATIFSYIPVLVEKEIREKIRAYVKVT